MNNQGASLTFNARVGIVGINPNVIVPEKTVAALLRLANKEKGPVAVRGVLNDVAFIATVVRYSGAWRLYLNGRMRKDAGVNVGDRVGVSLVCDPVPRMPPTPDELRAALAADAPAKAAWRLKPSSRRREVLVYLNTLKTKTSLKRNVGKVIASLLKKRSEHKGEIRDGA